MNAASPDNLTAPQPSAHPQAAGLIAKIRVTLEMIKEWTADRPEEGQAALLAGSREYLLESRPICKTLAERFLSAPARDFSWL